MKLTLKDGESPRATRGGWKASSATVAEHPASLRSAPTHNARLTGAPLAWASATTGFVALCLLTSLALFALLEKKWGMDFQIYRLGRTILVASIWIFLLHDAFQQSILFGALGLFPPFLLVYGALYTESSLLKGAFFALILWLGIEVLLIENRSYYAAMQLFIQQVIDGGNHWINHTSRS